MSDEHPRAGPPAAQLSRRDFLRLGLAATAGAALSACGVRSAPQALVTQPPPAVLQSPMPPLSATATPTLSPDTLPLERFMALSMLLTGMTALDETLGRAYLQALNRGSFDVPPGDFWQRTADASSLAELEQAGIFVAEATRKIADQIITYWYTGTVGEGDQAEVVTYVDALAWKALDYTVPHTICGVPGMWQTDPRNVGQRIPATLSGALTGG